MPADVNAIANWLALPSFLITKSAIKTTQMNFSGNSTRSARREFSGESFKRIRSNICAVNFFFSVNQFISHIYTVPVRVRVRVRRTEYDHVHGADAGTRTRTFSLLVYCSLLRVHVWLLKLQ